MLFFVSCKFAVINFVQSIIFRARLLLFDCSAKLFCFAVLFPWLASLACVTYSTSLTRSFILQDLIRLLLYAGSKLPEAPQLSTQRAASLLREWGCVSLASLEAEILSGPRRKGRVLRTPFLLSERASSLGGCCSFECSSRFARSIVRSGPSLILRDVPSLTGLSIPVGALPLTPSPYRLSFLETQGARGFGEGTSPH